MSQSTEARNKAIVLEAFDTLFNKRDYGAAARFWSPNYEQHSAHIEPGRYAVSTLELEGMVEMKPAALRDCLLTRERERVTLRVGGSEPTCSTPPFLSSMPVPLTRSGLLPVTPHTTAVTSSTPIDASATHPRPFVIVVS